MKKKLTIFALVFLAVVGLIGASYGIRAIKVEFAGETILIDSTATADTSDNIYTGGVDSLVFWAKCYDGADGNDTVVALIYYVSPVTGAITALGEIDTFDADGEVRKVQSTVGYWAVCVVVNRIGTADAGDSIEIQAMPLPRLE